MLGFLQKMRAGGENALSQLKDKNLFRGAAAACAIVGGIDNDWDDQEQEETYTALDSHTALQAFKGQAAAVIDEFAPLAVKFGGRKQLFGMLEKIAGHEQAETIAYIAIDVAMASDGLSQKEYDAIVKIAKALGVHSSMASDLADLAEEIEDE
ncbi:MAG: tellurite resistance TerB family protein [Alphaproteobacteria bacterium]|jgi:tellurite resistance protein|nr:tellurite resistance TerB family protein [Alphaproteobacteria bacterium]